MADVRRSRRSRIRATLSGWRDLARVAWRDPEHVSERMTLYAAQKLGEPSAAWAEDVRRSRPDTPPAVIAQELRTQSANIARVDGAIAGTPFFIALVPGYLSYLWQEGRMTLRTAALYGRDPSDLGTSAEVLALRGVHPTVEAAERELVAVRKIPMPGKPTRRRPLRTWVRSGYQLLIFGGFMSRSTGGGEHAKPGWVRTVAGFAVAGAIWLTTWVLPVTFMIAMAWGCETHTRQLGLRALVFYDGEAATASEAIADARKRRDRGHDTRQVLRGIALALSFLIPIGFVAYADSVRQSTGVNWVGALGALVAVSMVIAVTAAASRR